jgi:hypothetical protein
LQYNDPLKDGRVPDIIVKPMVGVFYAGAASKASHLDVSRARHNHIRLVRPVPQPVPEFEMVVS